MFPYIFNCEDYCCVLGLIHNCKFCYYYILSLKALCYPEKIQVEKCMKTNDTFKLCMKKFKYTNLLRMIHREEKLKVLHAWMCLYKDLAVY